MSNDLNTWVKNALDEEEKQLRQAVHICLYAIASNINLRGSMYIKGGILMAIKYHSNRFTRDIDFSTPNSVENEDIDSFLDHLLDAITDASEALPYNLALCKNSHKIKPPRERNPSFPTLEIKVGYATIGSKEHHRMLKTKQSTKTISIDYSYNESIEQADIVEISDDYKLFAYSITDLIAEKYRAVLQQVVRNRNRRQDIYDLWKIISNPDLTESIADIECQKNILKRLKEKCQTRNISPTLNSLDEPEVYLRSQKDYDQLAYEITDDLPEFDEIFRIVTNFYKSLPW